MKPETGLSLPSRRNFLVTTGTAIAAAVAAPGSAAGLPVNAAASSESSAVKPLRKVPIGVFDAAFPDWSTPEMLEKFSEWGVEAVEIGTGGFPGSHHCPVQELLNDPAKLRAWKKQFADRNIEIAALSCHGNPVHPDSGIADRNAQTFRQTVLLAEKIGVKVIVGFSGCAGGSPTDHVPNWITYPWPNDFSQALDWQWRERLVPYWKQAAAFARSHGIHRLAFEMCPNFMVYNPMSLLKLREAVGEEIGANCDLSHLFWQGCDAVEVIHLLGKQGAIFHAHMKDTVMYENNVAKYGVLNFMADKTELPQASEAFRAVGYGHSANTWKDILRAYMEVGYDGIFSVENEDPILPGEVGVQRALYVLKNVREELLSAPV